MGVGIDRDRNMMIDILSFMNDEDFEHFLKSGATLSEIFDADFASYGDVGDKILEHIRDVLLDCELVEYQYDKMYVEDIRYAGDTNISVIVPRKWVSSSGNIQSRITILKGVWDDDEFVVSETVLRIDFKQLAFNIIEDGGDIPKDIDEKIKAVIAQGVAGAFRKSEYDVRALEGRLDTANSRFKVLKIAKEVFSE